MHLLVAALGAVVARPARPRRVSGQAGPRGAVVAWRRGNNMFYTLKLYLTALHHWTMIESKSNVTYVNLLLGID